MVAQISNRGYLVAIQVGQGQHGTDGLVACRPSISILAFWRRKVQTRLQIVVAVDNE